MSNYIYPKTLMSAKELIEVGYPREMLLEMANMQGDKVGHQERCRRKNIVLNKPH